MTRRLPPLSALPAFEATARLGSVTAAAAELGRTHGAVSKQIAHLTDDLGGALFEKVGTGLKPTPRGERLRTAVSAMLDELDGLSKILRGEFDEHHVDLLMSATLATRWLIPRLPRFYALHPQIEIRLRMSRQASVPEYEVDVALSYDRLRSRTTEVAGLSLGDTAYGPVCAPDHPLREKNGTYAVPTTLTYANTHSIWQEWMRRSGMQLQAEHDLVYPHHLLALEAAAAGLGVAMAERRLVEQDLATKRLIAPFGFITVAGGLQATITAHATERKAVKTLIDWLRAEAQ